MIRVLQSITNCFRNVDFCTVGTASLLTDAKVAPSKPRTYLENDTEDPEVDILDLFGDGGVAIEPEAAVLQRDDAVHGIVGPAEDDCRHNDGDDGDPGAPQGTDSRPDRRVTDSDVAEHGQRDGQPHGGRMCRDVETVVDEEVADPRSRVTARVVGAGIAVEVGGVRYVEDHRQQVGDGERRQKKIGWTDERPTRQYGDVHGVRRRSKRAGGQTEVAVDTLVPRAEPHQRRVDIHHVVFS